MDRIKALRTSGRRWKIGIIYGPNTTSQIASVPNFETDLHSWADDLGVDVDYIQSNHEGKLLEFVHSTSLSVDGYVVNPGGLTRVGESLRHCLKDSKRPAVETHWDNSELLGEPIMAPTATSIFSGLGHRSVLGALTALVLALDDPDFLHPDGDSEFNRAHGAPRSLYQ